MLFSAYNSLHRSTPATRPLSRSRDVSVSFTDHTAISQPSPTWWLEVSAADPLTSYSHWWRNCCWLDRWQGPPLHSQLTRAAFHSHTTLEIHYLPSWYGFNQRKASSLRPYKHNLACFSGFRPRWRLGRKSCDVAYWIRAKYSFLFKWPK